MPDIKCIMITSQKTVKSLIIIVIVSCETVVPISNIVMSNQVIIVSRETIGYLKFEKVLVLELVKNHHHVIRIKFFIKNKFYKR